MPVFSVRGPVALPEVGVGDVATGLKAYWPHDEGTGTTLTDTVNAHNAVVDAAGWGSGDYSYNSGRQAQVADHADFNPGTAFSVFAWIKAATGVSKYAISQWDSTNTQASWIMGTDASVDDKLRVVVTDSLSGTTLKRYRSSIVCLDNTYRHFGFTWGSSTLKLYVDGALDPSPTVVTDDIFATVANSTSPICFGDLLDGGVPQGVGLNGFMKKVRYYNVTKSDADVLAIYTLGP